MTAFTDARLEDIGIILTLNNIDLSCQYVLLRKLPSYLSCVLDRQQPALKVTYLLKQTKTLVIELLCLDLTLFGRLHQKLVQSYLDIGTRWLLAQNELVLLVKVPQMKFREGHAV